MLYISFVFKKKHLKHQILEHCRIFSESPKVEESEQPIISYEKGPLSFKQKPFFMKQQQNITYCPKSITLYFISIVFKTLLSEKTANSFRASEISQGYDGSLIL